MRRAARSRPADADADRGCKSTAKGCFRCFEHHFLFFRHPLFRLFCLFSMFSLFLFFLLSSFAAILLVLLLFLHPVDLKKMVRVDKSRHSHNNTYQIARCKGTLRSPSERRRSARRGARRARSRA